MAERILFIVAGIYIASAAFEDWLDKLIPNLPIRFIIAAVLIGYGLFIRHNKRESLINVAKRKIGLR